MENRVENYKAAIAGFIKEGMIKEAMSAVDSLSDHSYQLGLEAKSKDSAKNDMINNPGHYQSMVKDLNIDAISCMRAAYGDEDVKSFCLCNALKYLFRCYSKGGNEDIKKCQWYLNKFMELGGMDSE
jgi:hypothetical protein